MPGEQEVLSTLDARVRHTCIREMTRTSQTVKGFALISKVFRGPVVVGWDLPGHFKEKQISVLCTSTTKKVAHYSVEFFKF